MKIFKILKGRRFIRALLKFNGFDRDILDLNEITAQLNTMVDEQGETVNKIGIG